ncbi:MAG: transcription-repair coupling factor [marine benthic group bacterium]|jgi:transcription-repair coupling factor (superfamily II helicase)|nr:transcription-repair coupling factor [Gemmatimonadota bacterium]MCL7961500.1 transcription-repair coupling factor [Candidatus Carthagonibacter metallireducens]MCL7937029.1 transcription-repair coupling factor [Gemmatimonadota bacterium]MCL7957960.1 transcription-repair coupling factor [Gemmatimonadota bacterium]MCL7964522.1 transcription-repair coupling factor [Gemmatimonadota bacterium]
MISSSLAALLAELEFDGLLPHPGESLRVTGCPGAAPSLLAASLARSSGVPLVLVHDTPSLAESAMADLVTGAGIDDARLLPQRETLPFEFADPHVEITSQRVDAFSALLAGKTRLLVTTARGLVERSPVAVRGEDFSLFLRQGEKWSRAQLAERLSRMGFTASDSVQELGDFAVRGGIVDLFPFGSDLPIRVELWDDEIASIRSFDLLSQRSVERHEDAEVLPVSLDPGQFEEMGVTWERRCLLELLPEDSIVVEVGDSGSDARRLRLWKDVRDAWGTDAPGGRRSAADLVLPPVDVERAFDGLRRVRVGTHDAEPLPGEPSIDLGIRPPPAIDRNMKALVAEIEEAVRAGEGVLLLCDNQGQLERLQEILEDLAGGRILREVELALGSLSGGMRIPGPGPLLVLTDHEVFQRSHRVRRGRTLHGVASLESVASLSPGDYVVHMDHGIGRYDGIERVTVGDETIETLKIEYADGGILRLPHYRIDMIEKWTGIGDGDDPVRPPQVHKIGGKRWKQLKSRTEEAIRAMATELLDLYAHREVTHGHAYPEDTRWQREMESSFLYEDTPDQRKAWEDVRSDMIAPRIMDRLVCGDVGYGKTEIAIRAAFKAVQDGKQAAVLAPTTILVEQHLHTFRERLAGFPVEIEALSRLRTPSEQTETLQRLASGHIDVVVGTHRLLSPDVEFRDLGLLVVDEEQRFGVRHKERLKELKRSVDVLTLTATPIPRTLQLALGGLRDMSLIETAPRDRMPVITHVMPWSDGILQDAMRRELDRAGQVFFVHDRIETIEAIGERVRSLVPDARIAVAHGQMPERELESVMDQLLDGEIDVLVSTSIIENGLDVPTANTMIVHRADRFGLAQLYQLRGRVGRSHHRAYCYLLLPPNPTPDAVQRLRILEHHTELGSGYRVALKDLQLRGAGNLLGGDQSGFAHAVGFDTYQRLLQRAVRRLRGEVEEEKKAPAQVSVDGEALLPDEYIAGSDQKLHLYRTLARAEEAADIDALREELEDRFGPVPAAADRWLNAARLKLLAERLGIERISVSDASARVNFRPEAVPRLAKLSRAFENRQIVVEVRRTQPLSLKLARAGVEPLPPTLIEALELLIDS